MSWHTAITALLVLIYFGLLTWTLRRRGPVLQGPWWFFLRAFFPNWKFFHAVGRAPRLYVRGCDALGQWSDWQLVYPRIPRRALHLMHNPAVNLALGQQNLVDHLAQDINDLPEGADIQSKVSYQLVLRLARDAVTGGRWGDAPMLAQALPPCLALQFELRMERPDLGLGHGADSVQMLLSPVMACGPADAAEFCGSRAPSAIPADHRWNLPCPESPRGLGSHKDPGQREPGP